MSRSSISSTQAPSSGRLTRTGSSYEGDIESLALTDSEIENCSVHSVYYSESWPSPAFPIISTGRSSSATLAEESSSLFESEYDTEISSSDTSAVIYTDNDFCRVRRTVGDRRVESAFATECDKRCKWETDGASDSRINTAHYSAPSLYNAKPIPNEASNLRFSVNADDFSQELYQSNASQQDCKHEDILTKFQTMDFENGAQARNSLHKNQKTMNAHELKALHPCKSVDGSHFNEVGSEDKLNTPETTLQESELAERDIIEKKRFLRKNFSSVLKEERKSVREARGNLGAHEMKLRSKRATSKYPQVREPRLTVKADSNKEGSFGNPVKWVVTRPYVNPRSKKFIKQRKKQDAIELDRRRAELLIMELKGLNLHEQAANVKSALAFKDKKEKEYDDQLDAKREEMKRKRLEEIRRKEEERKEKEDFERKKRIEDAKIRREKNRMLWESYNAVVLANSVSRSFTFSYFPKLRPRPLERPQTEPQKKNHSENHVEKCHR